jgi:hypothetical protein
MVALLLTFSQCNDKGIIENLSDWTLCWDKAKPLGGALPAIDLTNGITCHVPSEDAVYILNPTGECWKFTQAGEGISHASLGNVPGAGAATH